MSMSTTAKDFTILFYVLVFVSFGWYTLEMKDKRRKDRTCETLLHIAKTPRDTIQVLSLESWCKAYIIKHE